jgi:hypothetical protein
MKNILEIITTENMIVGLLLSFLAWLCLSVIEVQSAQAGFTATQDETKRVNEIVYNLSDSVIRIDENVKLIREEQKMLSSVLMGQQRKTGELN